MFNGDYNNYPYANYMPSNGYNTVMNNYRPNINNQPTTQQMSFVNGIEGAKGFIVPPNTSVFLMDSDAEQFFVKTADRNGMCNIKAYAFKEIQLDKQSTINTDNFVTKEEFNKFVQGLQTLIGANTTNATTEVTKVVEEKKKPLI